LKAVPALAIRREQIEWDLVHADGTKAQVFPRVDFSANRQSILVDAAGMDALAGGSHRAVAKGSDHWTANQGCCGRFC
jgi:hypothetical protein